MRVTVYVASAFSKDNRGGNKAGVVLLNERLSNIQKKILSKQLDYAETAFISRSETSDFKLEYFTPKEEVDLCGHATIATFVVLMYLNKLNKNHYVIETNSGNLNIDIKNGIIFMEQNVPIFYEKILPEEFANCFDISLIDRKLPIQVVSTGLKDILVPIKSESSLNKLVPNFENIKLISSKHNVIGMHLFTIENNNITCRNFAPLYDIDEESATGTSNCALASYLYSHNYMRKEKYSFKQGYSLNSLSEILVKLVPNDQENIEKIYSGGRGYFCETKILEI